MIIEPWSFLKFALLIKELQCNTSFLIEHFWSMINVLVYGFKVPLYQFLK